MLTPARPCSEGTGEEGAWQLAPRHTHGPAVPGFPINFDR